MSTARKNYHYTSLPEISQKVAKLKVMEMYSHPRQFILTNQIDSEYEYGEYIDIEEFNKNEEENDEETNILELPFIGMDRSYTVTPDLDYMLPVEVRETLISEGLSRQVVERSLRTAEKRHRQALYLTIQQQK
ncbi:hypothetical protein KUTeg_018734 [Tegillarca granosa]|uniref:Uncharacterized protein n=2 Tax=Tegillarca granosa TaxID=220873 RepID=A0ABQ9EEI3_TEGGR|nr:hypothetical protein KUTeg_018734 [Tegillarca granosa]